MDWKDQSLLIVEIQICYITMIPPTAYDRVFSIGPHTVKSVLESLWSSVIKTNKDIKDEIDKIQFEDSVGIMLILK